MTRTTRRPAFAILAVLASIGAALADQPKGPYLEVSCQWSDPPVAKAALGHLKVGDVVQLYCKTCGDRVATAVKITSSEVVATPVEMKQVNMNGGMLDLALAYVHPIPGAPWFNLSKLTKCGTPTANPDSLPASLISQSPPGQLPAWWADVQRSLQ